MFDAAEQGDNVAQSIIADGAKYISDIAKLLLAKQPPRLCLIGGLTPRMMPWLAPEVREQISKPISSPEMGAVLFAQQQLASLHKSPKVVA